MKDKITRKEIAEKFCKKCKYMENCQIWGNWKDCPHSRMINNADLYDREIKAIDNDLEGSL